MVTVPVLLAVAVNGSITPMYSPSGGGKDVEVGQHLSSVDQGEKVRDPAVVQYSSAKSSRTL